MDKSWHSSLIDIEVDDGESVRGRFLGPVDERFVFCLLSAEDGDGCF